jgi:mono/diheme cytochrome c family protein
MILQFTTSSGARGAAFAALLLAGLAAAGCTDMYNDARMKPLQASKFYADGQSSRPLVDGTVPRGTARTDEHFTTGKINGRFAGSLPVPLTDSLLDRGEERFNVFCSPCHGRIGDGRGMIVQRGFPRPNSFHSDSVRAKPSGYYFDVITNGFGRMYSYAPSIPVEDRWAIVAYLRALQLSRRVDARGLTDAERNGLSR